MFVKIRLTIRLVDVGGTWDYFFTLKFVKCAFKRMFVFYGDFSLETSSPLTVAVTQLVERSLQISEVRGSNVVICKNLN